MMLSFDIPGCTQGDLLRGAKCFERPIDPCLTYRQADVMADARQAAIDWMWDGTQYANPFFFDEGQLWLETFVQELTDAEDVLIRS